MAVNFRIDVGNKPWPVVMRMFGKFSSPVKKRLREKEHYVSKSRQRRAKDRWADRKEI